MLTSLCDPCLNPETALKPRIRSRIENYDDISKKTFTGSVGMSDCIKEIGKFNKQTNMINMNSSSHNVLVLDAFRCSAPWSPQLNFEVLLV